MRALSHDFAVRFGHAPVRKFVGDGEARYGSRQELSLLFAAEEMRRAQANETLRRQLQFGKEPLK